MEKLDKVIAALECHKNIGDGEPCRECPYEEYEMYCLSVLERDALELLRKLQKIREDYECGLILNYELPEMLWDEEVNSES